MQVPHVACSLRWAFKSPWAVRRGGLGGSWAWTRLVIWCQDSARSLAWEGLSLNSRGPANVSLHPGMRLRRWRGWWWGMRGKEKKGKLLKTSRHTGANSKDRSWQVSVWLSRTQQLVLTLCGNDVLSGRRHMPRLCGLTGHKLRRDCLPFVSHLSELCIRCFLWLGVKEQKRPF